MHIVFSVTVAVVVSGRLSLTAKKSFGKNLAGHWGFSVAKSEVPEQYLKRES